MRTFYFSFVAGIIMATSTTLFAQTPDPNFHIYLCFGQSNMEGQGAIETQDYTVDDRFQVYQALDCSNLSRTKGTWYKAVPPTCQCYSGLSPADYFGRTMVDYLPSNVKIGVINVAVGGCDIRLFDKDLYLDYDDTYQEAWFTDKVTAYGGNPYQHLIDLALAAQNDGVIKGILLHQGETNTGNSQWPNYVKKIYEDMLTDLSLTANEVPLIAGEVLQASSNCCSSMNTIINTLPQTVTTAHVVSSKDCEGKDEAHFNSAGYRILGQRYAYEMLTIMGVLADGVEGPLSHEDGYTLYQNFPNPASESTVITFDIPKSTQVTIQIMDSVGMVIKEVSKTMATGPQSIAIDLSDVNSGTYFYALEAEGVSLRKRMIVVKE